MKTEQEIKESNKREREINESAIKEEAAARMEYRMATSEAFEEYDRIVTPARGRLQASIQPHFQAMQDKLAAIQKTRDNALADVLRNWKEGQ